MAIIICISKKDRQHVQWPKGKAQKDKQRYTKHIYKKTEDRVTRTSLKQIFQVLQNPYLILTSSRVASFTVALRPCFDRP